MGSFSYTCVFSGLPITAGEKVRFLLVTKNPYDEGVCTQYGLWFPRTFPLKGEYNDYGSVNNVPVNREQTLWMEMLDIDMVERGWGENPYHDLATEKNMSFEYMLRAVQQGRLRVQRDPLLRTSMAKALRKMKVDVEGPSPLFKNKLPKGVPTRKRIQKLLRNAGYPLYKDDNAAGAPSFMVTKRGYGKVGVRVEAHGADWDKDSKHLEAIQPLLKDYASVITCGRGNHEGCAELRIFALPAVKGFHSYQASRPQTPCVVDVAMIREDVWQGLLNTPILGDHFFMFKKKKLTLDAVIEKVAAHWKECLQLETIDPMERWRSNLDRETKSWDDPVIPLLTRNPVPVALGFTDHWKSLVESEFKNPSMSEKELAAFHTNVAEFIYVNYVMAVSRFFWQPSYSCGPQCGEFGAQAKLLTLFANIAAKRERGRNR